MDIVVAFFLLGAIATALKADVRLPRSLYDSLTVFLLLAIGLKGGIELAGNAQWTLIPQSLAVLMLGIVLPLVAFPILIKFGNLPRPDSASIAAHYGSVSVGTFAVAVAFLEARQISYENYLPLFVVLLEMPAIAVGIWLARGAAPGGSRRIIKEVLLNKGVVLLTGGLLIGWWAGARADSIMSLFTGLFHGALALYLLEMGAIAANRIADLKRNGVFLAAFGVVMPLIGAVSGGLLGTAIGLSLGGTVLLAVLGASASYIAAPAAMRIAVPEARAGLSISASLGITFPFNVLIGIPVYFEFLQLIPQ
ncbi:MAG: sodium-dependent bicarbonate transport family permease [Gammaproteobacteria bacterium]|nr:sodium-dependent bicarbonate transport family permease [Gammaproteobacteria bacterium]